MDKIKVALLGLVVLLLAAQILDKSREPERMLAFAERIEASQSSLVRQQEQLKELLEQVAKNGVSHNGTANAGQSAVVDPDRDGVPKLGKNFLLPYDASHYHAKDSGGTLTYFVEAPKGLNPIVENSATASNAHGLMNGSLGDTHPKHPQLWGEGLATSCVISDDYLTYTFTIRDNVYWHIPRIAKKPGYEWLNKKVKLTAADFQATYDTSMHPDVEAPQAKAYLEDIESVKAISELELQIKWKKKVYVSIQSSLALEPLPRHVYEFNADGTRLGEEVYGITFNQHWFDEAREAIGVGAYMLDAYEPDKMIRFKRNPDYFGKLYHFDEIEWDGEVKQPDQQLTGFKNGDVHYHSMSATQYKREVLDGTDSRFAALDKNNPKAGREGAFGWEKFKSSSYSYIGWNMRKPFFEDKRVRRAMTHAFPKQRLIEEVYYGIGRPQVTNVHPDSIYYNKDLKDYDYDLTKAAALLDEAGWKDTDNDGVRDRLVNGKKVDFKFIVKYYANSVEWDSTLIIYKNELRKIGVIMEPTNYEWKELLRVYEDKDFDAVSGGWRFGLEVDFFQLWHSKFAEEPRSSNLCGFVNKRADEIAVKLRDTFEQAERIQIAKEFQSIIHDEQPYTFFRSGEGVFIWQNKDRDKSQAVRGVTSGLDEYHPLFNRSMLKWHFDQK